MEILSSRAPIECSSRASGDFKQTSTGERNRHIPERLLLYESALTGFSPRHDERASERRRHPALISPLVIERVESRIRDMLEIISKNEGRPSKVRLP